jgi:hypothetical protein
MLQRLAAHQLRQELYGVPSLGEQLTAAVRVVTNRHQHTTFPFGSTHHFLSLLITFDLQFLLSSSKP